MSFVAKIIGGLASTDWRGHAPCQVSAVTDQSFPVPVLRRRCARSIALRANDPLIDHSPWRQSMHDTEVSMKLFVGKAEGKVPSMGVHRLPGKVSTAVNRGQQPAIQVAVKKLFLDGA
jgi:hypothetical protein